MTFYITYLPVYDFYFISRERQIWRHEKEIHLTDIDEWVDFQEQVQNSLQAELKRIYEEAT